MDNQKHAAPGSDPDPVKQPLSAKEYVFLAGSLIGIGIVLLVLTILFLPQLVPANILDRFFYIVLVVWGLVCAVLLFGALRSYAHFGYRQVGTALELGGPAVVSALVVVGGFWLAPKSDTFDLTVRPSVLGGNPPLVKSGTIFIDLDNDRRHEEIGDNGEANFKSIPEHLSGTDIPVLASVKGYKKEWQKIKITGHVLYIQLTPAEDHDPDSQAAVEIKRLMTSEANLALSNSRDEATAAQYAALFSANAWIADSGSPAGSWHGREKIMARFRKLPRFIELRHTLSSGPSINDRGSATAEAMTEFLMENHGPNTNPNGFGKEQWTFVKEGEEWKIQSFRYNIP